MTLEGWVLLLSGLLAVAVVMGVTAGRYRLPLTGLLAVTGFIGGLAGSRFGFESPLRATLFDEVVLLVFLPVLVFEAALGLNTRAFVRNLRPILVLAIPALAVSAGVVGVVLHFGLGTPLLAAIVFGVLISATDPVAVVSVFRRLHVPPRLVALVEGESLFNDGVAIVLFNVLLVAALGGGLDFADGVVSFIAVFFGGLAIGTVIGVIAALILPWLQPLPAAALSIAVAYGSFALADGVLGFSGVMATVATGLILGGLAPSRAAAPVRAMWHELWHALGYVANGLLFLLIGLAIDASLLVAHAPAIVVAVLAVLAARPLAIIPLVSALERLAHLPPLGIRNLAVLVWGGLHGGVALALALALPEALPERSLFVAMAGGVVLASLAFNATTIGYVVKRTGLAEPTRADRFLTASAHLSGLLAARKRLRDLGLEDPDVARALDDAEDRVIAELREIPLSEDEEMKVVTVRGLRVERETYQHLSDAALLPAPVAHTLLDEVDDQMEELALERPSLTSVRLRRPPLMDRFFELLSARLPRPVGVSAHELAYAEASARRLAARRTADALTLFERLPNVRSEPVEKAKATFVRWEEEAIETLRDLETRAGVDPVGTRAQQAITLSRLAAEDALDELASIGLIPRDVAARASRDVEGVVRRAET